MPTLTTTRFSLPKELLTWNAPTRKFESRNKLWFVGLVVLAVALFVVLVIFNELLLGLLILSFAVFLFIQASVTPPMVTHKIYNSGVQMAEKTYLWDDLESFFIDENDNALVLKTALSFPSELILYFDEAKRPEIEETLLEYIPYIEITRTDYFSVLDGFIGKFSEKLPNNFTKRFVSRPDQKMTLEPDMDKITEKLEKSKTSFFKRNKTEKVKKEKKPNKSK